MEVMEPAVWFHVLGPPPVKHCRKLHAVLHATIRDWRKIVVELRAAGWHSLNPVQWDDQRLNRLFLCAESRAGTHVTRSKRHHFDQSLIH